MNKEVSLQDVHATDQSCEIFDPIESHSYLQSTEQKSSLKYDENVIKSSQREMLVSPNTSNDQDAFELTTELTLI